MVDMSTQNTKRKTSELFVINMCHSVSEAFNIWTTHAQRFYDILIITMNNIENTHSIFTRGCFLTNESSKFKRTRLAICFNSFWWTQFSEREKCNFIDLRAYGDGVEAQIVIQLICWRESIWILLTLIRFTANDWTKFVLYPFRNRGAFILCRKTLVRPRKTHKKLVFRFFMSMWRIFQMPGLIVFRRRWSVGSDDLVVPGAFLFIVHLIWYVDRMWKYHFMLSTLM